MKGQLRIDTMFAFVVVDDDGTEGVPAFAGPGGVMMPMVGADEKRVDDLKRLAADMARNMGKRFELVRFGVREHIEWIEP